MSQGRREGKLTDERLFPGPVCSPKVSQLKGLSTSQVSKLALGHPEGQTAVHGEARTAGADEEPRSGFTALTHLIPGASLGISTLRMRPPEQKRSGPLARLRARAGIGMR